MDFQSFRDPDVSCRPAPFWAINDKLDPAETARQFADLRDKGFGGGFFHSRHGLTSQYLGDEWFASMRAALKKAEEVGGAIWLYDDDLWPSGNAGGLVAAASEQFRGATLRADFLEPGEELPAVPDSKVRAAYVLERSGQVLHEATTVQADDVHAHVDSERLVLRRQYRPKTPWWSGESYANLLDPQAVRTFLDKTHEVYLRELGEHFGSLIPGIFTDEPEMGDAFADLTALPWYDGLPERYAAWTGRDFWADVPWLYFDGPHCRRLRLQLHRCVLRQFSEAFSSQVSRWCRQHKLVFTGHYVKEEDFVQQIQAYCGNVMSQYRYQDMPGIDHLCRHTLSMVLACKQVSSAARQMGKPRVLTEIFGVTRHSATFEDLKRLGDLDLALGATVFCPHLSLYSIRGRRKRDYPPNFNYQQSYWEHMRPLNDYFSRVGAALTQGRPKVDVLLLHPIEGVTADHRFGLHATNDITGDPWEQVRASEADFRRIMHAVFEAGYDCDFADEDYLADLGAVEDDGALRVGEMRYRVVLVPPAATWRPTTFELLRKMATAGGPVMFVGSLPTELDGELADQAWRDLAQRCTWLPRGAVQIREELHRRLPDSPRLSSPAGDPVPTTFLHHRTDNWMEWFFVVNTGDVSQEYQLALPGRGDTPVASWDAQTGERWAMPARACGNEARMAFTLAPAGSILLVAGDGEASQLPPAQMPDLSRSSVQPLDSAWRFERDEPNVLVVDRAALSYDEGRTWTPRDAIHRHRQAIADRSGAAEVLEWQPWVALRKGKGERDGITYVLRYDFEDVRTLRGPVELVVEEAHARRLTVNGRDVDLGSSRWRWDRTFRVYDVTEMIQPGANGVELHGTFGVSAEIEPVYLVGDFGVRLQGHTGTAMVDEPTELRDGSWVQQGYPFYAGAMRYRTRFSVEADSARHFLRLVRPSGTLFRVEVDGRPAGAMLWRPHVLELPDLAPGEHELTVEVVASVQNLFGPLHEREGEDNHWTGPNAFEIEAFLFDNWSLLDTGLLGGAELLRLDG